MSAFPPKQLQSPSLSFSLSQALSLYRSLSLSFPSLHCGSVNCSYSNIPSLPSPQLSYSQPLSCGIINLLVLSTCKSQTIEPYGVILGCVVIRFGGIAEPLSLSEHLTIPALLLALPWAPAAPQHGKGSKSKTKVNLLYTFTHNSSVEFNIYIV